MTLSATTRREIESMVGRLRPYISGRPPTDNQGLVRLLERVLQETAQD